MKPKVSHQTVQPSQVSELLFTHFANLMSEFYEMQSMFLSKRYKVHQSLETSYIIISLIKNTHLAILRQREKHLDHDISLENFFNNLEIVKNDPDSLERSANKIVTLVWKFDKFYPAEDYHQDYYEKNFLKYLAYKKACQREEVLNKIWN